MRAVQVGAFGGPEELLPVRLPDPAAAPGQVVVGLHAADVLFLDTMLRSGDGQAFFPRALPYVPGFGGAGTVLETGDGVDPGWVGRRVVVRADLGYAERIAAGVDRIVPVPDEVALDQAAAMMHDGVTALRFHALGAPQKGEWVLILAAAGGAGSLLTQLAVEAGARVVAAASTERKRALARELGAEVTVDYTRPDWADTVRATIGGGATLTYDGAGGAPGAAAVEATAAGGRVVVFGTAGGLLPPDVDAAVRRGIRVFTPLSEGRPAPEVERVLLEQALDRVAQGRWRAVIGATFPLERAADAHRALAARSVVGKSLLLI
ncbi:zinc-binding dehydrogenase [Catenuloplanes atrovinosus]|uniref:NADPH2:quinone reductase n=1 Tax=Catenuloplanes atrovinosus TaxID=137266 RepID=A0AAE4CB29_9ACTN|nr:zinc-binding dehydrogenase [Catenuloplanes atrovinosus]MDR7275190.1 NADPH2:quinone reductase [Catenuloplanes atrovinosus]